MNKLTIVLAAIAIAFAVSACQSTHEKGVTSNYLTQWTTVNADVKSTTSAAEAVLRESGLNDVKSNATNVDGTASGKKADGTKVNVSIRKEKSTTSQVSVTVGKTGDPSLGAELAKKIKDRADMGSSAA